MNEIRNAPFNYNNCHDILQNPNRLEIKGDTPSVNGLQKIICGLAHRIDGQEYNEIHKL